MAKDFRNLSSLEAIVLEDDDLLMIRGGQNEGVSCGVGCGQGCGDSCGQGCTGGCSIQKPVQGQGTVIHV